MMKAHKAPGVIPFGAMTRRAPSREGQWPMQTPSRPEPLMQREPWLQSLLSSQVFPVARFMGTLSLVSPEFTSTPLQTPSKHLVPVLQSVSNTQAKAGVEMRQRIVTTIRLLPIVVPSLGTPKIKPVNVRIWTGQARGKRAACDSFSRKGAGVEW